jgi:two-component system, chemotaxis family, sensor kinase CheA
MSNLSDDEEIKQLFIDESLEALQRCERLLLDAEEGRRRADLLDVLFRDFHTIKGTSALLGYDKIASVGHAAEDLMSKLRDKSIEARPYHFARMVDVVDTLRAMIENTRDQNSEGATDVSVLVKLLREDLERGNEPPAEAAPMPPVPSPAPAPAAPMPPVSSPAPASAAPPPRFEPVTLEPAPAVTPSAVDATEKPEPAQDPEHEKAGAAKGEAADGTVRVNVAVLDKLMNLMGELVLARNQMVQSTRSLRDQTAQAAAQRLSLVTSDLQEQIMKTRMQPVARVFEKIPRMVRDLCQQTGKKVAPEIDGTTTEIDKALVEAIRDPVMHIIRNAVDHGMEPPEERVKKGKSATGKISVRAVHEGSTVSIEIRDDGRGIDPVKVKGIALKKGVISQAEADAMSDREAINLIFRPGFSTAEKVTSISGRGVGMDVVRTHVERSGGQVELESTLGRGTTIRLKMPLTLAIIPALLVREAGQRFAIPQANLIELVYLDEEDSKQAIEYVRGAPIYRLRGEILPLVRLAPLLRKQSPEAREGVNIVVVAIGQRRYGLVVESIQDTEEIVIKPLSSQLKRLGCYAGATVLGDGNVALILDVAGIATMAGIDVSGRAAAAEPATHTQIVEGQQSMLVFKAGGGAACALPVSMVARLETIERSKIEHVGGNEVLQYRGQIMPVLRPENVLPVGQPPESEDGLQRMIVFDFGAPVGLAVNAIVDVTDVEVSKAAKSELPHVLGTAVCFGKTTMLVDIFGLVRQLAPAALEAVKAREARRPRVLLADEVDAVRAALAGWLRSSGVDVVELSSDAAVKELRSDSGRGIDALIASLDGGAARGLELIRTVKQEQPALPIVCTTRQLEQFEGQARAAGASAVVRRIEREAVLEALHSTGIFTTPADLGATP